MAKNVRLTWINPTQRDDGTPAVVSEIGVIVIRARLKALPTFTEVGRITDPAQIAAASANFPNTSSGTWVFEVSGADSDGQPMKTAVTVEVVVPKAALLGVSGLAATVS